MDKYVSIWFRSDTRFKSDMFLFIHCGRKQINRHDKFGHKYALFDFNHRLYT